MPRFVRPVLNLVIAGGLLLAVWPLGQTLYGRWSQRQLAAEWQKEQQDVATSASRANRVQAKNSKRTQGGPAKKKVEPHKAGSASLVSASPESPVMPVAATAKPRPWPLTKLSIPDIGLETFIVQGWDEASLRRGPGHLPQSAPAGQGNCVIAGHRNIYGSPFYRLDELMPGATITLSNRQGTFKYIVNSIFPTPDTNVQILGVPPAGEPPRLTILTCTMPHTNNRIVLQALLSS